MLDNRPLIEGSHHIVDLSILKLVIDVISHFQEVAFYIVGLREEDANSSLPPQR